MYPMRTEKVAVRVAPKDAARLRKIARARKYETLSAWVRSLLNAEIERDDAARSDEQTTSEVTVAP